MDIHERRKQNGVCDCSVRRDGDLTYRDAWEIVLNASGVFYSIYCTNCKCCWNVSKSGGERIIRMYRLEPITYQCDFKEGLEPMGNRWGSGLVLDTKFKSVQAGVGAEIDNPIVGNKVSLIITIRLVFFTLTWTIWVYRNG